MVHKKLGLLEIFHMRVVENISLVIYSMVKPMVLAVSVEEESLAITMELSSTDNSMDMEDCSKAVLHKLITKENSKTVNHVDKEKLFLCLLP
jgi:hypothetical protein